MKQLKYPWTDELIKMEYYLTTKKEGNTYTYYNMEKILKHYAKWKKSATKPHIAWFHWCEIIRKSKSIERESRLVVVRNWGWGRVETDC